MNLDPLTSREQAEHEDMERQDDWADAQHKALLESYAGKLWDATKWSFGHRAEVRFQRPVLARLGMLTRHAQRVTEKGAAEGQESDYQLDLLLTEWGAGKLIAYFGALAETEGQ